MMFVKTTTWTVGIVAAAIMGSPAHAESFTDKSGHSTCAPLSSEEIMKRPDGSSVRKTGGTCITLANLPYPFDHQRQSCLGTFELAADGKYLGGRGYCEIVSTKGDRAAFWYIHDPVNHGIWAYISGSGSGAYAGLKGSGTYKGKVNFPGGGAVYEWVGSWQVGDK